MFEEADEPSSDIEESAALALNSLLPEKSKEKYKKAYKKFENWCSEKRVKHGNEEVLLAYFEQKSRTFKGSTLWSIYSMLRATFNVNKKIEIRNYPSLIAFIKRKSVGQLSKKFSLFAKFEMEKFLKEAENNTYLLMKVRFL
jgi:Glu-tRNA(Gln) amidotransferase subunit E-like FAD-binding protein